MTDKGDVTVTRCVMVLLLIGIADPAFADCFEAAGKRHRLPPELLRAIACVESHHNPLAVNKNRNGSIDLGVMQINSLWLPTLATFGIERDHLWDLCTNVYVGAWVLAQNVQVLGFNWRAIGAYNAGLKETPTRDVLRYAYAKKVYRAIDRGC